MSKILLFKGSPRKGGNSDILADAFYDGAKDGGAEIESIRLFPLNITPCIECGKCDANGVCILDDDMTPLYDKIQEASVVVVSSPIFFYNITAKTQALVERSQAFWVRRYVLKTGIPGPFRKGIFLSVGATSGKLLFDGALRVMRYFFDAIGGRLEAAVLVRSVDKKAEIERHPDVLQSARELGRQIATGGNIDEVKGIWLPNQKK